MPNNPTIYSAKELSTSLQKLEDKMAKEAIIRKKHALFINNTLIEASRAKKTCQDTSPELQSSGKSKATKEVLK